MSSHFRSLTFYVCYVHLLRLSEQIATGNFWSVSSEEFLSNVVELGFSISIHFYRNPIEGQKMFSDAMLA